MDYIRFLHIMPHCLVEKVLEKASGKHGFESRSTAGVPVSSERCDVRGTKQNGKKIKLSLYKPRQASMALED
jgi:hypothetical protein